MSKKRYYITTAIAYANAKPHIGFVLELIYADVLARFQRLCGQDVHFVTGTDEHGQKIARTADAAGKKPQEFVNEVASEFQSTCSDFNISNDDFIRTTENRHVSAVIAFWQTVVERGELDQKRGPYLYKKSYQGLYCIGCEAFKTEKDLVNGVCPDHLTKPELLTEVNWFFRLSAFQPDLERFFTDNEFVYPIEKFHEAHQIVKGGLEDVSVSRSIASTSWGIPVPGDDSQVVYVWFDALINYLSSIGFTSDPARFKEYWPADVQIIGKEINRFHTILWVAMLLAAGLKPPKKIAIHGWITGKGGIKMSKSLGNVLRPKELLELFGAEATRYLLLREIPFNGDGEYSRERFTSRYDSELANQIGNLVGRVTNMVLTFRDGLVPAMTASAVEIP